jgi:barstar (barnase inhibitor)
VKVPDLASFDDAALVPWSGALEPLRAAATHAGLRFREVDLAHVGDKAGLMKALGSGLALPPHFGENFDALADALEDRTCVGKTGCVAVLAHSSGYRKAHPGDWKTLTEVLEEAVGFWQERHVPFWVIVA